VTQPLPELPAGCHFPPVWPPAADPIPPASPRGDSRPRRNSRPRRDDSPGARSWRRAPFCTCTTVRYKGMLVVIPRHGHMLRKIAQKTRMPLPFQVFSLVSSGRSRDSGLAPATLRYEHEIAFPRSAPAPPARQSAIRTNLPTLICDTVLMINYQTNVRRRALSRFKPRSRPDPARLTSSGPASRTE